MSNAEYSYIPNFVDAKGNKVMGKEVTGCFGKTLANRVLSDSYVQKLAFPRLKFPRMHSLSYEAKDYRAIAKLILSKDIKVYVTQSDNVDFAGLYNTSNFFVFRKGVVSSIDLYIGTVIHEMTHAIQDYKEMKVSLLEMELDAHFAQAYYMVMRKQDHLLKSLRMICFIIAAKERIQDKDYFKTRHFRQLINKMGSDIVLEYRSRYTDQKAFNKEFGKRRRLDGI